MVIDQSGFPGILARVCRGWYETVVDQRLLWVRIAVNSYQTPDLVSHLKYGGDERIQLEIPDAPMKFIPDYVISQLEERVISTTILASSRSSDSWNRFEEIARKLTHLKPHASYLTLGKTASTFIPAFLAYDALCSRIPFSHFNIPSPSSNILISKHP